MDNDGSRSTFDADIYIEMAHYQNKLAKLSSKANDNKDNNCCQACCCSTCGDLICTCPV